MRWQENVEHTAGKKKSCIRCITESVTVAARERGLWGGALPEIYKEIRKIYSFKCVKFFIKD
jgi:hypothetical protein